MRLVNKTDRPIFIDIDGTLTKEPYIQFGPVVKERIRAIKELVDQGYQIVIWSGGGTKYAKEFARKNGVEGVICIGKPEAVVDDNKDIRPKDRMKIMTPEYFFQ